jgi:hypothetical protein
MGAATKGHDEEHAPADLQEQIATDEQQGPIVERVPDRDGHQQTGEHQGDQHKANSQRVRIKPVGPPRDHVPGVEHRERHNDRLRAGTDIHVRGQVMRELADREDIDQVKQQLKRRDLTLGAGPPRDSDPHRRNPTGETLRTLPCHYNVRASPIRRSGSPRRTPQHRRMKPAPRADRRRQSARLLHQRSAESPSARNGSVSSFFAEEATAVGPVAHLRDPALRGTQARHPLIRRGPRMMGGWLIPSRTSGFRGPWLATRAGLELRHPARHQAKEQ